jgi:hypothetical protein
LQLPNLFLFFDKIYLLENKKKQLEESIEKIKNMSGNVNVGLKSDLHLL